MPPQWLMLLKLLPAVVGYLLIALLIRRGLGIRYSAFLTLVFLHSTSWFLHDRLPADYRTSWFVAVSCLGWVLYAYIVREMFGRMFGQYPGIARTGRRVIVISMLVALTLAFLTAEQDFGYNGSSTGVLFATIGERVVSAAIVVYLTLMLVFLRWMPVPVPENTARHTVIFFFYFVSSALVYHFWNRIAGQQDRQTVNSLLALVSSLCYAAWAWLLRPEGEAVAASHRPPAPDAERILGKLESLNRALGKGMAGH